MNRSLSLLCWCSLLLVSTSAVHAQDAPTAASPAISGAATAPPVAATSPAVSVAPAPPTTTVLPAATTAPASGAAAATPDSLLTGSSPNAEKAKQEISRAKGVSPNISTTVGLSDDDKRKILEAYRKDMKEALKDCESLLTGYENKAKSSFFSSFGLAMIGAIAGGIIAPTLAASSAQAHRAAIAAASGLSGVMNTAQTTFDKSSMSESAVQAAKEAFSKDMKQAIRDFLNAGDNLDKRADAIVNAKATCLGYTFIDKNAGDGSQK